LFTPQEDKINNCMFGTVQMSCTYNCMCDAQEGRGWPSSFVLSLVFTQSCKEVDAGIFPPNGSQRVQWVLSNLYVCM